ncbi:deoxyribodipyrimidine photo-lyase [Parvibaculum sp.]|uniref:cryptochrome/photolyase family protein n=1 Tax=Parvibaculum sp. TaxID=2024848 RepID=UPI0027314173|nr:deoxyribodipyrimidine photo-lyase [Parvibaculum sp.]MDP1626547.1 deoxyribodipyrimidine photo-lyase [Parvibaculum sp.]MDP2150469.1 deoxyribodipyrimidine photo-lyase [Parvibaculum sp.]MDP3327689.1 deoxyribodipyrimidine photo-lyase [Parvibaculum sp.]
MSASPVILWFRRDLRLDANPALAAAVARGPVIPLFILDPADMPGAASRWWLHGSLHALGESLARLGAPLILRRGSPSEILPALAAETGARAIFWNRLYEPPLIARDKALKSALTARDIEVESFNGSLLAEPWQVRTQSGGPYKVFTPFWRALAQIPFPAPLPAPKKLAGVPSLPSDDLSSWPLRPSKPDWAGGLRATWQPGERAAHSRLAAFIGEAMNGYREARDIPAAEGTSRLSPHLHWGEISPHRIWATVETATAVHPSGAEAGRAFLRELAWRDFAHHLLFHWPDIARENWKSQFDAFPWRDDTAAFTAWTKGETGYPIVDAGMRQLWQTGWMHNRVRMIAASFLVKHLMIDWRRGAEWFEDTLVDADLAVNRASWQWVAGSGADAAPYFRIFNPVLQGEKFDGDGAYVRTFVPELARLDPRFIHKPWAAPAAELSKAGIALGRTYPKPLVDHGHARARALAAFEKIRNTG